LAALGLILLACAGCPQYRDPTVPGEVRRVREPLTEANYYLYAPLTYDAANEYALIVVCHGTTGFDSAKRQMGDWAKLAEEKQFIVITPVLKGVNSMFPPPVRRQVELQRDDERRLLSCVRHVRNAYSVAADKVFLTGWSGGGYAVLYTGLKNPDVFRAVAVLQGNFNGEYVGEVGPDIDPFQPVYVLFGSNDILSGRHGKRCVKWLQEHGAGVTAEEIAGVHKNHPKQAYGFFERVVRKVPWLHIRVVAEDPADPLTIRLKTRASFKPHRYKWSFGDGTTSALASPVHTYAREGNYTVTLEAKTPKGKAVRRAVEIELPQTQVKRRSFGRP
jgi:poly(3-hydroxybutyrate) depolymerase